jgi:hypothetical protein
VLKFSRPDAPPPWSGRAKPVMEITCSGRASVQTIEPSRPDDVLIQERFLCVIFRKIISHSCPSGRPWFTIRTAHRLIFPDAHSDPQTINRGPWALRASRIRCEFHNCSETYISSEALFKCAIAVLKLKSILEVGSKIKEFH